MSRDNIFLKSWVLGIMIVVMLSRIMAVGQTRPADGPVALSFQLAVQLALEGNFNSRLARERTNEAHGRATMASAGLLPELTGAVFQRSETVNLAALGFQRGLFPGDLPLLIGPFNNFDARARLVQSIFNLRTIRQFQAGQADVRISNLEEQLVRRQVVTQVALGYLNAISADRSVAAAQANLNLAQSLFKQAKNQRDAGIATGVDVTRAETRVAEEQMRLAQSLNTAQRSRLILLRTIGLPLGTELMLTEVLQFKSEAVPPIESTVAEAERERLEIQIAEEELKLRGYSLSASRAERLPSIDFVADYGQSGSTPAQSSVPTRNVGVRLNVPLFNMVTKGRIDAAQSRRRQAELQLNDARMQVEEDVRLSLQTISTVAQQVKAAQQTVALADRELQMARDRFTAGIADNLEVINAQASLANARVAEIAALAQYKAAQINLAAALGGIESFKW